MSKRLVHVFLILRPMEEGQLHELIERLTAWEGTPTAEGSRRGTGATEEGCDERMA